MKRRILAVLMVIFLSTGMLSGCSSEPKEVKQKDYDIAMADVGWDSIRLGNAIAGLIAEEVFGYKWHEVSGSTPITHVALMKGEIDVHMEIWTDNLPSYQEDVAQGKFKELGVNFNDNIQGFYVPRYVIEGDKERGIEPVAPDLKTVQDLKKYPHLFPDDEDPTKGRLYGGIPGWEIDSIMYKKYMSYGLDKNYNYFRPGTDAAMSAALVSSYEKGIPIVAYYWEPTWLLGKYDFVLLEDAPYDPILYKEGNTACPSVSVNIGASNQFAEMDPEFSNFLSKYNTSSAMISEALAYIQDTKADYSQAAVWFLQQNEQLIDEWLNPEQAEILRASLDIDKEEKSNPLLDFPFVATINTDNIDSAVQSFSVKYQGFFDTIKGGLTGFVAAIRGLLDMIPWWVMMALVIFLGYKSSGRVRTGIIYSAMLFLIGVAGLWQLMNETLAIVLASVILALLIGLPLGILISSSRRANDIVRPILDTMQTMPVFVYLIPAVMFFGMGSAPAVIATVIYAVVPVIRLTSLGIRQVDKEVVEAARAFGSTNIQALFKVQIPQALPTIMTGVNQTMMMAMAMVVTCSMIGARGLGNEVLIAVNRIEISRGVICGTAVVVLAVLLDRLTQGWFSDDKKRHKSLMLPVLNKILGNDQKEDGDNVQK